MKPIPKSFLAALLALIPSLYGCPALTRAQVDIHMWQESGLPKAVCQAHPEVAKSGIYRRLNDDQCNAQHPAPCYEFLSYCNARVAHYISIQDKEYNDLLDAYLPKGK